jgi:hypothetical protein
VTAPAEWADTLTLFHLYQYMYSVVFNVRFVLNDFLDFLFADMCTRSTASGSQLAEVEEAAEMRQYK